MSQGFKLRYDQMREGDPTKIDNAAKENYGIAFYETAGYARNVCLVWPNGKRVFLNYAYLIVGELVVEGEMNVITLAFSSHSVTLKGYGLETLFTSLLDHLPRIIIAVDSRYVSTSNKDETLVTEISVEKKDN